MIDVKKYIESGILDEYAAGIISENEKKEVEALADIYPEIAKELNSINMSLAAFALVGGVEPPDKMEEQIWAEILNLDSNVINLNTKSNSQVSKPTNIQKLSKYSAVATLVIMIFVTIGWAVTFKNRYDASQKALSHLDKQNQKLNNSIAELEKLNQSFYIRDSILSNPNTTFIKLSGIKSKSPKSKAYVVWDKSTADVYIDILSLPKNPPDKQYQLWAISQIGRQISVGLFDVPEVKKILPIGKTQEAVQFFVSLEPKGGAKLPTLKEKYIYGNVDR